MAYFLSQTKNRPEQSGFCSDVVEENGMALERMNDFFAARLAGYDEHMLTEIEGARDFYPYTASLLPLKAGAKVLDLGCGTGLELEFYFQRNGEASVVGIDLSKDMLKMLQKKFADRRIDFINGSYFDIPLGEKCFDAAVSVESLHHYTDVQKLGLYTKLNKSLTAHGYFVLTDYFAESEALETHYFSELERQKKEEGLDPDVFYHYDTPLTVGHEMEVLRKSGFSDVQIMKNWGATYTLLARR